VPKVHNKPIKRPRKGFKQREQGTTEVCPGLAHRTVRCTRGPQAKLRTFGNSQKRFAIIHRTVRCPKGEQLWTRQLRISAPLKFTGHVRCIPDCPVSQRSNGYFARNGRLQRIKCAFAHAEEQCTRGWHTGQSTGLVRCATGQPGGPTRQSSNGRNPTARWRGWRTGQCLVAHWTVRCARRQQPSPNG
jgi:hypothetical protein